MHQRPHGRSLGDVKVLAPTRGALSMSHLSPSWVPVAPPTLQPRRAPQPLDCTQKRVARCCCHCAGSVRPLYDSIASSCVSGAAQRGRCSCQEDYRQYMGPTAAKAHAGTRVSIANKTRPTPRALRELYRVAQVISASITRCIYTILNNVNLLFTHPNSCQYVEWSCYTSRSIYGTP